jgi:glucose-1-phosphate thymidylyltransferase
MERISKAAIMARGLGTRMRKADESAVLSRDQETAAGTGVKAMMTIDRPFLDYVLSGLADAGYSDVCLIIGPEHQLIRDYYIDQAPPKRVRIHFAVQEKPLGTADAVMAAKAFAGSELFLVINSDNYYPTEALGALRGLDQAGVALFDRDQLVAEGNIPAERVQKFAVASVNKEGYLEHIYEKPDEDTVRRLGLPVLVSMNSWIFSPAIFDACLRIQRSIRGELELTDAIQYSMDRLGERYKALAFRSPVLDLSSRSDVAAVARKLRRVNPNP